MFEMHGLVQLGIRTWLSGTTGLETWKQEFIARMHNRLKGIDNAKTNPTTRSCLLAHANTIVFNLQKKPAFFEVWKCALLLSSRLAASSENNEAAASLLQASLGALQLMLKCVESSDAALLYTF